MKDDGDRYDYARNDARMARILLDLDRCEHGRHAADVCLFCPTGHSTGNLLLPEGMVIGHGLDGSPIVVPPVERLDDWTAWRAGARR